MRMENCQRLYMPLTFSYVPSGRQFERRTLGESK